MVGSPTAKVTKVSVPGSDVTLDFTDAFGGVHFNNRAITLTFLSLEPWDDAMSNDMRLKNAIHGRKLEVSFDDDPDWYWNGRASVGEWAYHRGGAGKIVVTIDAEPYKYKQRETVKTSAGNEIVHLRNSRMPVVPYVSTSGEVTLAWAGHSVTLSAGADQIIPQLVLEEGVTDVQITGAATVIFRFREGSL